MLNSTLHLNVFGRVNRDLIDKDSQCIYQLSRLSTLSHWSLPRSREWEAGAGRGGEDSCDKKKRKKALLHTIFFAVIMFNSLCVIRFRSSALWGLAYTVIGRLSPINTLSRLKLDNIENITYRKKQIS